MRRVGARGDARGDIGSHRRCQRGSRAIEVRARVPVQWDTVLVNYADGLSFSLFE